MRGAAFIVCLALRGLAVESNEPPSFSLGQVLPDSKCYLEEMGMQFTDRARDLGLRMRTSIATNQAWYFEHIRKTKPGEPIAYDRRLGLTREEYFEFQNGIRLFPTSFLLE